MVTLSRSLLTLADDPYDMETLRDPYPFYMRLREAGPIVWIEKYGT
jgi:hypothetical protein